MRETTRHVAAAGLTQAGVGESLEQARAPGLFRGAAGTVALISAASTFPDAARAGNPRGKIPARPGHRSVARADDLHRHAGASSRRCAAIARDLHENPPARGDRLDFGGRLFVAGEKPAVSSRSRIPPTSRPWPRGCARRARRPTTRSCRSTATRTPEGSREAPPPFLVAFAHAMIDAGADVVVGHGPHVLRAVEIYRGRPILYSLGNFLFEYETVGALPADDYESVDLPPGATPDDFFDRYDQGGARGYPADAEVWESAVAVARWKGRRLEALELHPITLGFGLPRGERGRPRPGRAGARPENRGASGAALRALRDEDRALRRHRARRSGLSEAPLPAEKLGVRTPAPSTGS